MLLRTSFLLVILGLGILGLLAGPVAADGDAEKIDQLIEQLGSGTFKDRESATKALDAIGAPALEKLRKAAESEDLEIKRRAADLVKRIEKRAESSRVLQAKRVHLVYKDTPLKEAIADFKKKSGYDISLHDPDAKVPERKITLDTGDVTFWEAFDKFCDAAGVQQVTQQDMMQMMMQDMMLQQKGMIERMKEVAAPGLNPPAKEAPPRPAPKKAADNPKKVEEKPKDQPKKEAKAAREPVEAVAEVVEFVQAAGGGGVVQIQVQPAPPVRIGARVGGPGGRLSPNMVPADQITLIDGKRKALPTHYAGSVRIRAMEPSPIPGAADAPMLVNLQVSTEPRTQLRQMGTARITKAVDDNGQSLSQAETGDDLDNIAIPPGGGARAIIVRGGFGGMSMPSMMGGPGAVTIPLKKGEKPSKSLKELTGTLTLQMLDVPEAMLTVDNVLKAGGTSVKGKAGGELRVVEATKSDNGQIKLQVELDIPPDVTPAGQQGFGGGMMSMPAFRVNAVMPALPAPPAAAPPPADKPKAAPAKEEKPEAKTPAKDEKPQAKAPAKEKPVALPAAVPVVAIAAPAFGAVWDNGATGQRYPGDSFNGLTLLDDKGNKCPISRVSANSQVVGAGSIKTTYELTFAPKKDQGAPAKLVFSGSKAVTVEVPFTLKDVPLK